jgi:GNAT superfamily N-acetyltransferase
MRVVRIEREERPIWAGPVAALEAGARYPLGADRFRIDHGRDYFAFFDRLGDVAYYAAVDEGEVIAVGCGVLRHFTTPSGPLDAWYIGDLKVRPEHRGKRIPLRMFAAAFGPESARCRRGYGISMNAPGARNRVLGIFERFPGAPIRAAAVLRIWSLTADEARAALPIMQAHRGAVGWLSLAGVKDIVLESTGRPMPLLHAQFGPQAAGGAAKPTDGAVHMLCAPDGDALTTDLIAAGFAPGASATVITLWMDGFDWRTVLTSEI